MQLKSHKKRSVLVRLALAICVLLVVFVLYFLWAIYLPAPDIRDRSAENLKREQPAPGFYRIGNNWLKKSASGLWEMYLEGDGFTRGVINGKLTKELAEMQETVFISQIRTMIPSESYLQFLKYFVAYFNRNVPDHISKEYQQEIYGVSLSATDKFDHLAPKYYRILNYHSAHDIGHALQDKNMTVGCTSFGVWNSRTTDGKLLVGRNFDFFAGEDFAKNKIVCFTKPEKGNRFMYITWAGFTGVVSGMNDKGLSVTINASKSEIPSSAATPISLLAKEILQYSENIEGAFKIAQSRRTFVSESILIGSAADKKSFIIEKTPSKTILYSEKGDEIICANHFRSPEFEHDYINNKNKIESSSLYRKIRMDELVGDTEKFTPEKMAAVLRNQDGLHGSKIGLTNEKGVNQLLAHHSVIFKNEDGLVWVSTAPFQLGKYICYDLNRIWREAPGLNEKTELNEGDKTIPEDPFLKSEEYHKFLLFKSLKNYIRYCTDSPYKLVAGDRYLKAFKASNPESYYTYEILGDYYKKMDAREMAINCYTQALQQEVATLKEKREIAHKIEKLKGHDQ